LSFVVSRIFVTLYKVRINAISSVKYVNSVASYRDLSTQHKLVTTQIEYTSELISINIKLIDEVSQTEKKCNYRKLFVE